MNLSVCIPIYNGEVHLRKCLDSILTQTRLPDEVVLGINASEDSSLAICEAFISDHPELNIQLYNFKEFLPMGPNWNRVVRKASSDAIKVLPCDDVLLPDCLKQQMKILESEDGVALVVGAKEVIGPTGKRLFKKHPYGKERVPGHEAIRASLNSPSNRLGEPAAGLFLAKDFEAVNGFHVELSYFIDLDFWIKLLQRGDLWSIHNPLYRFRIHSAGASARSRRRAIKEFMRLNEMHRNLRIREKIILRTKGTLMAWARDSYIRVMGKSSG